MDTSKFNFKTPHLPPSMLNGEKFIKWDEDSAYCTPVTLKVDKYGFYLHWMDQNNESDVLDIALLRDTRTGKTAKTPKDSKLSQLVTIGCSDTLEEKTLTLVFGTDFINLTFINFCCNKKEIAKLWCDELLKLICNRVQANASALTFLLKAYTKLTLLLDRDGKIPLKNIMKMFAQSKDEGKRIEKALDSSGLPSAKNEKLNPASLSFEDFITFYKNLTQRQEVEKIFNELCGENNKRKLMSVNQFADFINTTQRDPRLNEILHPYVNVSRAKDLIQDYEPNKSNAQRGQFSFDGFLLYLMSEDNSIMTNSKLELSDDMDQPLAHYYINSSHNTYIIGSQWTGKSSVEMYRQCLLAGCRCVELDFWDGKTGEPVIVHGYTLVPEISAREVIEAIAESAFKTSDYPVILSFENHCGPRQQVKIAQYCRDYFGEMLLDSPLESHKLLPGVPLPPPSLLKHKIIIKNKKKHHHHHHDYKKSTTAQPNATAENTAASPNGEVQQHALPIRQGSKDSSQENDEDDEDEDESSTGAEEEDDESIAGAEEIKLHMQEKPSISKVTTQKESEAGAEISALVNYVQPVHFTSFENAEKKNRSYEMSSFEEKFATALLKEQPIEFVNYNKNQLSRVYPAGARFDSSNFLPHLFWNAGCQLLAINYQTLDLAMQLNLGIFEYNQRCGYLLKPEFLRRRDRCFDPFTESTVDGIIAGTVSIHILSGQFLSDKKVGTYVEVDMYGLPADTIRKKFKTKICLYNGINPVFSGEPFVFKKVVLPDFASIRIAAYEENGKLIGHRVLPVVGLCPGYRHVVLKNESGQSLPLATLFVHVVVKDYIPDDLSNFAEALANPIKWQSELERRERQLEVFMDENEPQDNEEAGSKQNTGTAPKNENNPHGGSCPNLAPPDGSLQIPECEFPPRLSITPGYPGTEPPTTLPSPSDPSKKSSSRASPPHFSSLTEELVAESLEKLMESKIIKEKKTELEKKLESHRKKFDKERRLLMQKASQESDKAKPKLNRLIKRLSIKTIDSLTISPSLMHEPSECSESDGDTIAVPSHMPRPHSEKLINMYKSHIVQEREIKEKYHEIIYNSLEKVMRNSQSNQLKILRVMLEKEIHAIMRRLEMNRREDVKIRVKKLKDKDEVGRIKREAANTMVEKGVTERKRLIQIYEKSKECLEKQHQEIKQQLSCNNIKEKEEIMKEYEEKLNSNCVIEEKYDALQQF